MNKGKLNLFLLSSVIVLCAAATAFSQLKGLKTITEEEVRMHLEFIAADEFRGRETPSTELEICTLYLATMAKHYGLKPILPDGSFYQSIPVDVRSVSPTNTRLRLLSETGEQVFYFLKAFGGRNLQRSGTYSGEVVFAGLGLAAPEKGWDDCSSVDLSGRVVVILDAQLPEDHGAAGPGSQATVESLCPQRPWCRRCSFRNQRREGR